MGLPGFVRLVRRNRALAYDLRRIAEAGGPVCCEVLPSVLYALSRLALGRASLTGTIVERMYDERAGLFRPVARPRPEREPTVTWAALSPLALPDLPEQIGRRLIEEHLLDPERFWLPVPPPSVPVNGPLVRPAGVDARDQALLARADLDQRGVALVARNVPPGLQRRRLSPIRHLDAGGDGPRVRVITSAFSHSRWPIWWVSSLARSRYRAVSAPSTVD